MLLFACAASTVSEPPAMAPRAMPLVVAAGGPNLTPTSEPPLPEQASAGISLSASSAGGGTYRVGSWLPVQVTVQNDGPDFTGEVRVSAGRGGASYAAGMELPKGSRKSATIYVLISSFSRRLTVRLIHEGRQLVQQQLPVDPHSNTDRLVAVASENGVPRLPASLPDNSKLFAVALAARDFPERAAGLSSFDALLLDDLPTGELNAGQRAALRDWVARGGRLLIGGGPGAQRTLAGLPEELQPVLLGGLRQLPAESLLPDLPPGSGEVRVAEATPAAGTAASSNEALGQASALLWERPLGQGLVSFSALALNEPALALWQRAPGFWAGLLRPVPSLPPGFGPTDVTPEQVLEGNIASSLVRLPALELPALTTLGLLLLVYIILAGPVTYLVLRRLDRQAMGWVVVPLLTLVFAAAAYGVGYRQRGGDVVLNQISVVEPLDAQSARVRSFVGLFSPKRSSYTLEIGGSPLLRPISLQGPWDTSDQGGVFQQQRATSLDIPQWSMRAVLADTTQPFSGLEAQITLDASGLHGEVTNNTSQTLRDVVLVQDVNVAHVGDLLPGEQRSVSFDSTGAEAQNRRNKFGGAPISYLIYSELIDQMNQQGGKPLPPEIQLRQGLLDAMYSSGPIQRNAAPLLFAWSDAPPLQVEVPQQRVARQQLTLLVVKPQLLLDPGPLALDQGWMQRNLVLSDPTNSQSVCMGSKGLGVSLFGQPAVQTLTLPRELRALRPSELRLLPSADGPWPQEVQIELYDWASASWISQPLTGDNPLAVAQPERFLNGGELRARISGQVNPQMGGGCLYVDASVKGELP
jgi:hypothetical protein